MFCVGGALYMEQKILLYADTQASYYARYLENNSLFGGYFGFNPGETSGSYSDNSVTWNATPANMAKNSRF